MSRRWSRARRMLGALAGVAVVAATLVTLTSGPASAVGPGCQAGQIEVTTSSDAALRAAFTTANTAASGPSTICIDSGLAPITLTGGELAYTQATSPGLTLLGNGITISGNNLSRVINSNTAGPLTLNGVTITGGNTAGTFGGGVSAGGSVTLTNSTISGNTAGTFGGGVSASGSVTLTNSTISGNHAAANVGGGVSASGSVTLTNSTISGNTAANNGGGVFADGPVTVTNSTISGNTAAGNGGGIESFGAVTLVYATVVGNSGSPGANVDPVSPSSAVLPLVSFGSVVALPGGGGANCAGLTGTTSHGFNLEDDAAHSCGFSTATGDPAPGTSSGLAGVALANNGGSTLTLLPPSGSALIDAIPPAHCSDDGAAAISPLVDQIGLSRPQGAGCEIGAKEVPVAAAAPPLVVAPSFTG